MIFVINISRNERLNWRDDGQIYYYLKTAVREALDKYQDGEKNIIPETLWKENINFWVVVLRVHDEPENIWYILEKTLTDTRKKLERHQLEFSAYISEIVTMRSMHRQWVAIRRMIFDRIGAGKGIFFVADFRASEETGEVTFEKDLVSLAFRENDETQMAHLVNSFILELGTQQNMSRQMIQKTIMDWQQAVFHFLEENQILAETLYANDEYIRLLNKTDQSLEDYRCFLHYLTGEAIKAVKEVNETDKLVNILKHYIDNNLQEDLSRQALANVVFLSPDYLALIFRRKTGKSVRQYVMERRMMRARDLLRFSSAPVYTIAAQVGFPSSSYFAKNFKQFYGQDPTVFRKNS